MLNYEWPSMVPLPYVSPPWRVVTRPPSPPTHPCPFTHDEQEELRKIARDLVRKRDAQAKREQLEKLATELGATILFPEASE